VSEDAFEFSPKLSLSAMTGFRTGGPASVLFPKTVEFASLILPCLREEGIAFYVLGNGSNVLALDEGYGGLIVCTTQMKGYEVHGNEIVASAGVSITHLATVAQKNSLAGMEFFYGIPGSVGGAVFMNAGAYGGECKDILKSVTFVTENGEVCTAPTAELAMGYRTSLFEHNGAVILSATFALEEGDPVAIRARMDELMGKRVEKQPLEYPSAGSTFKRCEGHFTAQMIDEAGLKGYRVGGAMVSEKHAGFVINYDNATSEDILKLIEHIKEVIMEKNGLAIQCEVRLIQ
jgi:UDP-N-acetylmuramate dehydrogenase